LEQHISCQVASLSSLVEKGRLPLQQDKKYSIIDRAKKKAFVNDHKQFFFWGAGSRAGWRGEGAPRPCRAAWPRARPGKSRDRTLPEIGLTPEKELLPERFAKKTMS